MGTVALVNPSARWRVGNTRLRISSCIIPSEMGEASERLKSLTKQIDRLHGKSAAEAKPTKDEAAVAILYTPCGWNYSCWTLSPGPGVHEYPFMTWGEIEGTPLRLDLEESPVDIGGSSD
ncbi:hypothetical protein ZIOFF_012145 [Zingiber officinale]|uniref:Uncharacterized protein n=1 Tax=Zingiber officinale TaxID=94328 RepID=A0A8J5HRW4_ZINOF|nr:hypothetical protein ZIOFF_012145 [Zingiber officinale]